MKKEILSVPFDNVTRKEALKILLKFLKKEEYRMVFTPNPEMVMEAAKDYEFLNVLKSADLVIPDGIGIVLASKLDRVKLPERVGGCDLFASLFKLFSVRNKKLSVYLLGAKPGVAELAKKNLEARYTGVEVVGLHHGYFDATEEKMIIKEIKALKPDVLLVGFNFPKQEKWIYTHRNRLPVRVAAGVGGSIDIYAGVVKRAPVMWRRLGLEWLFRLISEPRRAVRMLRLPLFAIKYIGRKMKNYRGTGNED